MLKACEQAVYKLGISLGKAFGLCPLSTHLHQYLTSQVFFVRRLCTVRKQSQASYRQPFLGYFNLLSRTLSPFYTGPMTNTNLIKE
jgi:hypothetical protein